MFYEVGDKKTIKHGNQVTPFGFERSAGCSMIEQYCIRNMLVLRFKKKMHMNRLHCCYPRFRQNVDVRRTKWWVDFV